ncbi:tRNA ligase [Taxawa tesnikishii (nom. ined.)]|nr:tRNA ligase [Dothideales sp. JES 119]
MAHREQAPYRAQDVHEISEMLRGLEAHQKKKGGKGGFSCKKATFSIAGTDTTVDSWRMQDWDYKKPNLPTYARGNPEIVVRGYDKFFNHGEVRKTEWRNVEQNTRGPYELSVKENGCIIFISGLEDGTLLVCSKHSTGAREDAETSHAIAGERWVDKHLATVGKNRKDLALKLREMNATAVAELCDDEFEEHVLAYNPETAGLYLHGINLNLPEFVTYPGHLVDRFATEWGFKKTMYVMEDDIKKVKSFLDKVAETGNYAGRDTEGFVIRCQARETADSPWEDWFFKYKFEEPYLMYRQWRECTKAVIAGRPPKYKKHKDITEQYLLYARKRLHADPSLGKAYNQNHGIIKMRDDFLAERGLKGSDIIKQEIERGEVSGSAITKDVVIATVATIGCGKTTVALALAKLFNWGHIQNDNIQGKGRPARFAQLVCDTLLKHPVTIADRNNHQRRERKQLIEDVQKVIPQAHFIALHYVHEGPNYDQIREKTRERVLGRGDNHQTIQAGSKGQGEIIEIMEGFMHRFEPVNPESDPDDGFDLVIDLDPTASSRENLETVLAQLNSEFPRLFGKMPTGEDLDNAIEAALNDYKPDIHHEVGGKGGSKQNARRQHQQQRRMDDQQNGVMGNTVHANGTNGAQAKPKERKIEYFGVTLPAARINAILDAVFRDQDANTARMYRQLQQQRRIQSEFHVTLMHRASASQNQEYWNHLSDLHAAASDGQSDTEVGKCKVMLERLVWDNRLMCIVARLAPAEEGKEWRTVNDTAHVTVGTADQSVKPKESNDLLKRWLKEGSQGSGIQELAIRGHVELTGTVKGMVQKH